MSIEQLTTEYEDAVRKYSHKEFDYVTGVDVGIKYGGADDGQLAVRLHVNEKVDLEVLERERPDEIFARVVPKVTNDVVESRLGVRSGAPGRLRDRLARRSTLLPVAPTAPDTVIQPGESISRASGLAGTLGLVAYDTVRDRASGHPRQVLVSCWHVLAYPQARTIPNLRIVQPAAADDPENVDFNWVGTLGSLHRLSQPGPAGDCAFAYVVEDVLNGRRVEPAQTLTDVHVSSSFRIGFGDVEKGLKVSKVGWSSGVTHGLVDGVGTYFLNYGSLGRIGVGGLRIVPAPNGSDPLSRPGDSGACWYLDNGNERSDERKGVGIHFEGDAGLHAGGTADKQPFALACHLTDALEELKLSLTPPA